MGKISDCVNKIKLISVLRNSGKVNKYKQIKYETNKDKISEYWCLATLEKVASVMT